MSIAIQFDRSFALEKSLSVFTVALVMFAFDQNTVLNILIIGAIGHFWLADIYRMKKKKPEPWQYPAYAALLAFFFYFAYAYTNACIVFVSAFFLLHCFWDEHKLSGVKPDGFSTLFALIMTFTQSFWIMNEIFLLRWDAMLSGWIVAGCIILFAAAIYMTLKGAFRLHTVLILFGLAHVVFVAAYFAKILPDGIIGFRWIVLFHGTSWYIYLARRYHSESKEKFHIYIRDVAAVLGILVIGFFLCRIWPQELSYLHTGVYKSEAYFAWALVHLVTTLRPADYMYMVPWRIEKTA